MEAMLNGYSHKNGVDQNHKGRGVGPPDQDFSLAKMSRSDIRLIRMALNRDWPIKRGARRRIVKHLDNAIEWAAGARDPEQVARCASVFVAMDAQNLRSNAEFDKRGRLDAGTPTENVAIRYRVTLGGDDDRTSEALPEATRGDLE